MGKISNLDIRVIPSAYIHDLFILDEITILPFCLIENSFYIPDKKTFLEKIFFKKSKNKGRIIVYDNESQYMKDLGDKHRLKFILNDLHHYEYMGLAKELNIEGDKLTLRPYECKLINGSEILNEINLSVVDNKVYRLPSVRLVFIKGDNFINKIYQFNNDRELFNFLMRLKKNIKINDRLLMNGIYFNRISFLKIINEFGVRKPNYIKHKNHK